MHQHLTVAATAALLSSSADILLFGQMREGRRQHLQQWTLSLLNTVHRHETLAKVLPAIEGH